MELPEPAGCSTSRSRSGRRGLRRRLPILFLAALAASCSHPSLCPYRSVMPARDYWSHILIGNLWEDGSTDGYLCVWIQLEEGTEHYRVSKQELADRKVKEEAFRNNTAGIIAFLEKRAENREGENYLWLAKELTRATGLELRSGQEWIDWWHLNEDRLHLSPDGRILTVSPSGGV